MFSPITPIIQTIKTVNRRNLHHKKESTYEVQQIHLFLLLNIMYSVNDNPDHTMSSFDDKPSSIDCLAVTQDRVGNLFFTLYLHFTFS